MQTDELRRLAELCSVLRAAVDDVAAIIGAELLADAAGFKSAPSPAVLNPDVGEPVSRGTDQVAERVEKAGPIAEPFPTPAGQIDGPIKSRERIETEVTAPNPAISAVDRPNARLRAAFVADPAAPVARRGPRFGDLSRPWRRPPSGLPQTLRPAGELEAIEAHIAAKGVTSCPAPITVETSLEFNPQTRKWRRPTA